MLRKNITGAKYYSNELHQMTNLNIATPIDKNDVNFGQSDILLAKDVIKLISTKADSFDYKSVQKVIADLIARIEQLETKVKALEDVNIPA